MTLLYLVAAWLAGIAFARSTAADWWVWGVVGIAGLIGLLLARSRATWRTIFACLILFTLGGARFYLATPRFDQNHLATYNGTGFATIEGVIVDAPDVRDTQILLRVRAESLTLPDESQHEITGLALVQAPRVGTYRYGDPVLLRGELRNPPEGETFSYRDYLAREGVHSLVQYAQVEVIGERRGNPVRAALLDFRGRAHEAILRLLPDPQASLLAGILLGIESGISPDVRDAFNATGTTHIIAISGANLAILAGLILGVTRRFLSETWSAGLTIAVVFLYAAFVGGDPAVTRAAVMASLGLVAARLGRQTYGLASLSFAALVLTAINPFSVWDVGFQLSFLATLGLILYVEPLQKWIARGLEALLPAERAQQIIGLLSEGIIVTVAAQITTTPIMAYHFERFSVVSLPVNLLIVPVQPAIMVIGGLGVLAAMLIWPLGQLLVWASWVFLSYTLFIVRLFAKLPLASLEVQSLSLGTVVAMYAILFGATWLGMQPEPDRARWRESLNKALNVKALGLAGVVAVILLLSAAASMPDGRLHITFIEMGDGSATLIETPSGRRILVDGGSSGRRLSAALGDALPFWDRRLDVVVITQPTTSRIGGLLPIAEQYDIGAVVTNGVRGNSEIAGALSELLESQQVPELIAQPGMRIHVEDGVDLRIVHTQAGSLPTDSSEPGELVTILLTYHKAQILLTGEWTESMQSALLSQSQPTYGALAALPANSLEDGESFWDSAHLQVAILRVRTNASRQPDAARLELLKARGIQLYRTDESGTIHFVSDGEKMWITTENREQANP